MEEKNNEEHSLAWELLTELKASNQRLADNSKRNARLWFFIAIVELAIIVCMVIGFFVYESQYEYGDTSETYQTVEDTEMSNSTINQSVGE